MRFYKIYCCLYYRGSVFWRFTNTSIKINYNRFRKRYFINFILVKNTEVLQYLRVRVNRLTSINISLKDMEGNSIMFLDVFAFVVVKLHFRKTNE